jgi:hypothetical protein
MLTVHPEPIPVDAEGHEIPWAEDDRWIECGLDDADFGEPEGWPDWTDEGRWEADQPYEPSAEDMADYLAWSDRLQTLRTLADADRLEAVLPCHPAYHCDADIEAAGLPVG